LLSFVRLALRRPYTAAIVALLIALLGVLSITRMIVDIFPVIDIPVVLVVFNYPGLSAEDVQNRILLVAQRKDDEESPEQDGLYTTGTVCRILQVGKQPDGTVQVVIEGLVRGAIAEFVQTAPFCQVRADTRPDPTDKPLEIEALMRGVSSQFERYARLSRSVPPDISTSFHTLLMEPRSNQPWQHLR